MEPTYRNYLFDLYGTLVDIHTDEESPRLWMGLCRLLAERGIVRQPEALRKWYFGRISQLEAQALSAVPPGSFPEVDLAPVFQELLGGSATEEETAQLAWAFRRMSLEKLRLFPQVREQLLYLRQRERRVFLLSNAQALFTRPELKELGLEELFDGIFLSSEVGRKKPDPVFFGALLEEFHLDPAETVMVGNDDVADCWGAAKVGLDSVYLRTEQSPEPTVPLPPNCQDRTSR